MASGISFTGLSSSLDTDSIVTALTTAETSRKTTLQKKQNTLKLRQAAYVTLKSSMSSVARAAGALNTASTFSTVKSTVGDEAVATIATTSAASVGTFDLAVSKLAKANKISSAAQIDTSTALGKAGTIGVNGKTMKIEAGDSLANVAQKINGLGVGVNASVVDGGSGKAYLTLSSSTTGVANAVSLTDLEGTALSDLGILGSGSTVRQSSGNAAVGSSFSSNSATLQSVLGTSGLTASTITIGGTDISVDPSTDTMDSLATKINAAGITGVSATVASSTKDGATTYSLQISGSGTPPSISESGNVLRGLGILRSNPANELVASQDAAYTLDGVSLTSATNTITGVIGGATLTLKKAAETSISLAKDTGAITTSVNNLISSVNGMLSTIEGYSAFDTKTYESGVLFGDSNARQAKESVRSLLFTDSPGVTGATKNLASIGVGLDEEGKVTLDDAIFQKALEKDPEGVMSLFQSIGKSSNADVKYVSATSMARASTGNAYGVNITQVATKASLVAGKAQTGPRTFAETLTFRGGAFGSAGTSIDFGVGSDLSATVAKINADSRLKDLVSASIENGKLRIDSKKFGTGGNFTLTSNFESSAANSGIGVGGEGTAVAGVDVAGTIAGEPATGSGQFLIGATGNSNTEGLQIQYTGSVIGDVGTISLSRGAASRMTDLLSTFTDSIKGSLTAADDSLQTQIDGLDDDIAKVDDRITSKSAELKKRFAAMEDAIAKLKSQSSSLASLLSTNSNS